jgi:hypothetical protein
MPNQPERTIKCLGMCSWDNNIYLLCIFLKEMTYMHSC